MIDFSWNEREYRNESLEEDDLKRQGTAENESEYLRDNKDETPKEEGYPMEENGFSKRDFQVTGEEDTELHHKDDVNAA